MTNNNNTPASAPSAPIMNNFLTPEDGGATDNGSNSISQFKPSGGGFLSSLAMGLDQKLVTTNNSKGGGGNSLNHNLELDPLSVLLGTSTHVHEQMQLFDNEKELKEFSYILQKQAEQKGMHIKGVKITNTIMNNMLNVILDLNSNVTHLKIEDCPVNIAGARSLADFLKTKMKLIKLTLISVAFSEPQDLKSVLEGVTRSMSLRHLTINGT